MKNRKVLIAIGILLVLSVLVVMKYLNQSDVLDTPDIHYHAGFVIFDNGKKVDFSNFKYMNITPCTEHGASADETPEHTQLEKAHLHDSVGDVVHSHRAGAKWGDLFTNINYPLDYSQTKSYINGEVVENVKDLPISADSSLVIFVGQPDVNQLSQAVTLEHVKEVEAKSESCGE